MKSKSVLWDMDGTLVDSEALHEQALVKALETVGISPPDNLHELVNGVAASKVYQLLYRDFGLTLPFQPWLKLKYGFYMEGAKDLKPREGALQIFRELDARGILQAIVSNSDRLIVDANLRAIGLQYPGIVTVSRNDVRYGKPDPEPFLRGAWLLGVDTADAVVVEDSIPGACAGVAAGMRTLLWPQTSMSAPQGCESIAHESELRTALGC